MMNTVSERSTDRLQGAFYAFVAILLWATVGVVYKLTLRRLDGFVVTLNVEIMATLILGVNLVMRRKVNVLLSEFRRFPWFFCIAGMVGNGMQQIFYLKGFQLLPTTSVVMLFYIYPLLMLIVAAIGFHERLSARSWLLTLTGMGGMVLAIVSNQPPQIAWNRGIYAPLLAACSWALFSIFIKHKTFDADCGIFLFNLFGLLFLLGMIPAFGFTIDLKGIEFLGITYLALFPTAIAFMLWYQALRLTDTAICSSIALFTPCISLFLAVVILHESILLVQGIGFMILLGSVFLNINHSTLLFNGKKTIE